MWSPRVNFGLLLEGGYSFRETVFKMVCCMLLDRCLSVLFVCLSLYCGQMVGWIKMPLGMVVGLGPGDIVLAGDPAPPHKGAHQPPPPFSAHCFGTVTYLSNCWVLVGQQIFDTLFVRKQQNLAMFGFWQRKTHSLKFVNELWSSGPVIPCGDMQQALTDALVKWFSNNFPFCR